MADDYGTCPHDLFADERLDGAPIHVITGHALVVTLADDWGRFDGNPRAFARRIGSTAAEVQSLFDLLVERRLARFYEAPGRGETVRRVGCVIDYHSYRGHPDRVAFESKRGASEYPFEDGTSAPPRRLRGSDVEATGKKRGSDVEATGKKRGSDVASRARDQNSTEQHSTEYSASSAVHSVPDLRAASTPAEPALGAGSGGSTPSEPGHPPSPEPRRLRPDRPDLHPDDDGSPPKPRPPKPPGQVACEAFEWRGNYGFQPGQAEALLAWARELQVPERKLRKWLETRHGPYPEGMPMMQQIAYEHSPPAEVFG